MISVATSTRGNMCKQFCKQFPDGKRAKFSKGFAETVECESLESLRHVLNGIESNQVLITSYVTDTVAGDVTNIGTEDDCQPGEIPRIKSKFSPSRIFLVDYDYTKKFPCRRASDVHAYMCRLLPDVFTGAAYLSRKSSSCRVRKNGKSIKQTSFHLYYLANDAFKLNFLPDNIMDAAEKMGLTYLKMSSDGKMDKRTVIDLMPLKIGANGLVYEAAPEVDGDVYTLADSRIHITPGGDAHTSGLSPIPKAKKAAKKPKLIDVKSDGYWCKSRKLQYSPAYRALTIDQAVVLDDICIECRFTEHGTQEKPIRFPTSRFRVDHRKVKKCLDGLTDAGFIRYVSGVKKRTQNQYFLNFEMLFMKKPKGWCWDA